MKRTKQQYENTAYHEAGHAVAAWRFDLLEDDKTVTIVPDETEGSAGQTDTKWGMTEDADVGSEEHRFEAENKAVATLAGYAAGRHYRPRCRRASSEADYDYTRYILHHYIEDQTPDAYTAEMKAWIRLLEVRAKYLIACYWPEVEAVAKRLLEDKTLTGKQVLEICKASRQSRLGLPSARNRSASARSKERGS